MNQKHLLSLLQNGYTTVNVTFTGNDPSLEFPRPPLVRCKVYTYKARLEDKLEVGDHVVVDSPTTGLSIAVVTDVHKSPQIDLDAPFTYKWIVQKVDRTRYDEMQTREAEFLETMMEVERTHQRELLLNKFKEHLPEGSEARKLFETATQKIISLPTNGEKE